MAHMATSGWKGVFDEWRRHGAGQMVLRSRFVRPWLTRAAEIIYWHSYTWAGTTWMGVPAMKYPADAWTYQEILFDTKPDLIIETGTNRGGSALFLAHMCDLMGRGRVITVDIEPRPDRPAHPRITYVTGSSLDADILRRLAAEAGDAHVVMVILDSDHAADHVFGELEAYSPLVTPGAYLICEDTNVNGHPVYKKHGPGPTEALARFLPHHPEFRADVTRESAGMTAHPGGFLRRTPG
jgi:cephalosporin hydroxylase